MKFVCDNCKAKYQIGDEKVAGKTLRMKCRRCGHMIQVAASVTESSVSTKLPTEQATGSAPEPIEATPPPGPAFATPASQPSLTDSPLEGPADGGRDDEGATIVKPSPLFLFESQKLSPGRPVPAAPPSVTGSGSIPRPLHAAPAPPPSSLGARPSSPPAPRIVPPARASMRSTPPPAGMSSPGTSVPRAPLRATSGGTAAALAQAPIGVAQPTPIRPGLAAAPMPTHAVSSPGLYGGFVEAVSAPQSSSAPLPTEDWYVGIAGVPLGPVRLSVLREKASQGQVDAASLVWREGYEEWQAVSKLPALLELVEDARLGRNSRASATPAPGMVGAQSSSLGSSPVVPEAAMSLPFDLVRGAPHAPGTRPIPPPADSNVGDRPASLGLQAPAAKGVDVVSDPFAPKPAATGVDAPMPAPSGYGLTTTAGFSNEKVAADLERPSISAEPVEPRKKRGLHPMVWAFIAMAAAFGGVAAWAVFLRKPDVVYVNNANTASAGDSNPGGAAPPAPPKGDATADTTAEATAAVDPMSSSTAGAVAMPGGGPRGTGGATTSKPGETATPFDTSGFGGPSTGPKTTGPDSGHTGSGPLSSGEAQGVVAKNSPRVRRNCWDPQVSARSSDAPNSVKVNATLNVGADGSVKSANVSGGNEKHYPGLVSCVQSQVKGWRFPPSGEGGTVVVPFGFNAQ
ncbi:MAG: DUF4339 domain-containing protein [Polyangiaceae bacterium]|nr:DUF4339 domain-containing protein [Polyangiaceae bacterium]